MKTNQEIRMKIGGYFNSEKTKEFINTMMDRKNLNTTQMVCLITKYNE